VPRASGLTRILARLRGSPIDHGLKRHRALLGEIDAIEPSLTGVDLGERAAVLRGRDPDDGVVVQGIALVREAARRVLGLRMHEAQVLTALALRDGKIAELATGEGKTLAAVAPAWLSALSGRGVHVLTFNDFLARRDAAWMGPIYERLGCSVGCVQEESTAAERRRAYACDVTYGTAKQAGFDYLRDGMALRAADRVHRPLHHAIVDEADSLMIDEARVPLVLAGGAAPLPVDPRRAAEIVHELVAGSDYDVDENARNVTLTEEGLERVERALGVASLVEAEGRGVHVAVNLALHAQVLLHRDVDYIVRNGRIQVVDEFTGRVVPDRRWPDGLHPALEAKEGLTVGPEGSILASIPLQHFFRLYPRLAGMTATAQPAAEELHDLYGVAVAVIPPHRPSRRVDEPDRVFSTREEKDAAVSAAIAAAHAAGRPVLVGTASVAESERLSAALARSGIAARVLNARNDDEEARVIAEAGRLRAVTISTNMAGRGTDIRLGGTEVEALGGLLVIGTNRHESRRIDDQLRGRAGRQGDPGSSRFFVSAEDDLAQRYGLAAGFADLEHAQRVVEGQNADIRRKLFVYTSMVEQQRRIVSDLRESVLTGDAGRAMLAAAHPGRLARLTERAGAERTDEIARRVVLLEIDKAWCGHLARLADVRENIHMHWFAGLDWFGGLWGLRKTPVDVFHEMATAAFAETQASLEAAATAAFDSIPEDGRVDLDGPALSGPASTWTYIVNDTPFEGTIIRLDRLAARLVRGRAGT
jgi:preprotein translocase subunit SecA